MRIAIVGSGYVGLVAAACLAELGHEVTCVDNDVTKIDLLNEGVVPIHEECLPELLAKHRNRGLRFTCELRGALAKASAVFVAVGTPSTEQGEADMSYVEAVSREIARTLDGYKVVVEKSTVPVLTHDWVRRVMLLNGARPDSFDVASNPEFLREGTAVRDFLYPDRIVLGVDNQRSAEVLHEIYEPLTSGRYYRREDRLPGGTGELPAVIVTSAKSAELIKHASNAFLATKVSFINAVANVCEAVGADIEQVCQGIGADSRIGRKFLYPGIGYGGSCFPKDLKAFHAVARECGYDFRLLEEVSRVNHQQLQNFVRKVKGALWTLRGKKLAVLGLAFKGGTDDVRESPALGIVEMLLREGCEIRAYDPAATERARAVLPTKGISYVAGPYEAAEDADALLILTDWKEFAALDLERLREALAYPIVIDGRNLYDPAVMAAAGFIYCSIGRADAVAEKPAAVESSKNLNGMVAGTAAPILPEAQAF